MAVGRIVLITAPADQGDILEDFLEWHYDLGVDLILAFDHHSKDGSRELLERHAQTKPLRWFPLPERDILKFDPATELATLAREQYEADWIIHCDADEFLCVRDGDLRTILDEAAANNVTMITVPRRNITGPPLPPGGRATETLTLRIDRTVEPTPEQQIAWNLPAPFLFLEVGGHLAVRAAALDGYGMGAHVGSMKWGTRQVSERLYILHYAIRGFESLEQKVRNTAEFFAANPHVPPAWGWHWRRWIHLHEEGRLREDYDLQFISDAQAAALIADGTCSVDDRVAMWTRQRKQTTAPRSPVSNLIERVSSATIGRIGRALGARV